MTFPFFKKQKPADPARIILARTDKIGDIILSIPSFYMVREIYPNAKIMAVTSKYNAPILKHMSIVDETIILDKENIQEATKKIVAFQADVFIALYSDNSVLKLAAASRAKTIIGPISKPLSWFVYNSGVIQKRSKSLKNEAEYNLDLIRELDHKLFDAKFKIGGILKYSITEEQIADKFLKDEGIKNKFIIVHMFAGGSAKNFTPEEYSRLVWKIWEKLPETPIILTGYAQEYAALLNLKDKLPKKNVYYYKAGDNILELAALIDKCHVFIGGSTGPTHMAGSLRKKTVAIFPTKKSQSPTRWGLFGNEKNTIYIMPDEFNKNENYKVKNFDKITPEIIEKTACAVVEKFHME